MNSQPDYPGLRAAPEQARGRARRHRVDTADQINGCARAFAQAQARRGLESSSGLLPPINLSIPTAPRITTNSTDSITAIAQAFSESQQRAHPIVVGLPFGAQPPPDSFGKLASRFAERRSPEKEAQAKEAMSVYHAICEGRMVVVED